MPLAEGIQHDDKEGARSSHPPIFAAFTSFAGKMSTDICLPHLLVNALRSEQVWPSNVDLAQIW
jgi:hypothetical protein